MSTRSLARFGLVLGSVVLACGGHSAVHGSTSTTSDAGAGDASASDAAPIHDASATEDEAAAGDSSATLDAGGRSDASAAQCVIPDAAKSLPGCASLVVACISAAIDCACSPTQYQMLCQTTATPPSSLGCIAQSGASADAPAYCCACGSDDAGL